MTGPSISRRQFAIGGLFLAASGVAYAREPKPTAARVEAKRFESWVPAQAGPWQVVPSSAVILPPSDELASRLYDNMISRVFAAPNLPSVMMLMAYNNVQNGVIQVHLPEKCYSASGLDVSSTTPVMLPVGNGRKVPANTFSAVGTGREEQVLYWTRVGQYFPRTWAERRVAVLRENLAGDIPDGVIMRVSLVGNDAAEALPVLTRFTDDFLARSAPPLQRLLVGAKS